MIKPLELFKTKQVKDLLSDFYFLNFEKAFRGGRFGREIVEITWDKNASNSIEKIAELFNKAKQLSKYKVEEVRPMKLFNTSEVKVFLDYGANKLRGLNEFGYDHPHVEKLIAIDVIPQNGDFAYPEISEYFQITEDIKEFPVNENSVDLINVQFVLHHVQNKAAIIKIINNLQRCLKVGGKIILWEESFEKKCDVAKLTSDNNQLGIKTDFNLTNRFYDLSPEQRWEFIIVNDWIFNVNNPHMQWTGQYFEWDEWIDIMHECGLQLEKYYNLGIRVNGQIKHGVHIVGEFIRGSKQ